MPARKPPADVTPVLQRMLRNYQLARIEIVVGYRTLSARGFPENYHPAVALRREAAIREAGGSVALHEMNTIQDKAYEMIGFGRGDTLREALDDLEDDLKREAKTRPPPT